MRTSRLPKTQHPKPNTQAGYTLLEVLLALMILGAASALVIVTIPPPEPTLAGEARALAARLTVAAEEAIVSGAPVGVVVDSAGYSFRRRIAGDWLSIEDDPALAPRTWPEGVSVEIIREGARLPPERRDAVFGQSRRTADGRPIPPAPVARFDPAGAATTMTVFLSDDAGSDDAGRWRVAVDAAGVVSLTAGEAG